MRAANGGRRGEQAALLQLEEQEQRQRREAQRGDAGESHRACNREVLAESMVGNAVETKGSESRCLLRTYEEYNRESSLGPALAKRV